MSNKTWLILDVSFCAHRAMHTTGKLSNADASGTAQVTGVLFGLFRDIQTFQKQYNTKSIAFCFDHPHNNRFALLPTYKETRRKKREESSDEDKQAYAEMHQQITLMRKEYLPSMGFKNVFYEKGYEADDLIAQICRFSLPDDDNAIIFGSDKDLYQLLSNRVSIWNTHKKQMVTKQTFKDEYNIKPKQWTLVKAIAGCGGDDVPGIHGIGDITAAKYLSGELKKGKKYESIINGEDKWRANLPLVSLPYKDCPELELQEDAFSVDDWNKVMRKLGMKSLVLLEKKSGFGFGDLSL